MNTRASVHEVRAWKCLNVAFLATLCATILAGWCEWAPLAHAHQTEANAPLTDAQMEYERLQLQAPKAVGSRCVKTINVPGQGPSCATGNGGWIVKVPGPDLPTHGPDLMPAGATGPYLPSVLAAPTRVDISGAGKDDIACVPETEQHAVLVYARAHNGTDRFDEMAPKLREQAYLMSAYLNAEAKYVNPMAHARLKFSCDSSGVPIVINASLDTVDGAANFATVITDLRSLGYGTNQSLSAKDKYIVFYDGVVAGVTAQSQFMDDSRLSVDNYNNSGGMFSIQFTTYINEPAWQMLLHEYGHSLGAVQFDAPNTSGNYHCNDGFDVMCYGDGGKTSHFDTTACPAYLAFDCGNNDYFNPIPDSDPYLEHAWNIASSVSLFVEHESPETPVSPGVTIVGQYASDGSPLVDGGVAATSGAVPYITVRVVPRRIATTLQAWVEVAGEGEQFGAPCGVDISTTFSSAVESIGASLDPVDLAVPLTGLRNGERYRWRACAVDGGSVQSRWITYGADPAFLAYDGTLPAPRWVSDGTTHAGDIDASNTPDAIFNAVWDAPPALPMRTITDQYCVTSADTADGCDSDPVVPWSVATSSQAIWSSTLLQDGSVYRVCVRRTDQNGDMSPATCSNGIRIDTTAPNVPAAVFDGWGHEESDLSAEMRYFKFSWDASTSPDTVTYEVCISSSTECDGIVIWKPWIRWDSGTGGWIAALNGLIPDTTMYYVCVRAIDNAGNTSAHRCSDGIFIDRTYNRPGEVRDGWTSDIDRLSWTGTIAGNWDATSDTRGPRPSSYFVDVYEGPSPPVFSGFAGENGSILQVETTATSFEHELQLEAGQTYWVCVMPYVISTHEFMAHRCSDGMTVDDSIPIQQPLEVHDGLGPDIDQHVGLNEVDVEWTMPSTFGGDTRHGFEVCVSRSRDCSSDRIVDWNPTLKTSVQYLGYVKPGTYYGCVRPKTRTDTGAAVCSDGITLTEAMLPNAPGSLDVQLRPTGAMANMNGELPIAARWTSVANARTVVEQLHDGVREPVINDSRAQTADSFMPASGMKIRARSVDAAGRVSPWITRTVVTSLYDAPRAFASREGWSRVGAAGGISATRLQATRPGAVLSTTVKGSSVAVVAPNHERFSRMNIYIDGKLVRRFVPRGRSGNTVIAWSVNGLSGTQHTIRIVAPQAASNHPAQIALVVGISTAH